MAYERKNASDSYNENNVGTNASHNKSRKTRYVEIILNGNATVAKRFAKIDIVQVSKAFAGE